MGSLYGINSQTWNRLPQEDRTAIRTNYLAQQQTPDAPDATPAPVAEPAPVAQVAPAVDPATTQTPQQAVAAIHAMPVPDNSDLAGLPSYAQQATYQGRAQVFNQTRGDAAQAALDRLAPQRSDYASLNGATASMELRDAQQSFNANPYVAELGRIVTEAKAQPTSIPAYLTDTTPAANAQSIPLPQMQGALGLLGIDIPDNASPQQIADGYQLLATVPDNLLGQLINPGMQVSFESGVGGLGTPSFVPLRAESNVTVQGQVELGDVQTGVDFNQTQQFEMQVQVQGQAAVDLGKTPLNQIYKWADRLGQLPDSVRDLANSSPLMKNVLKGLPVSGSYTEFTGTRLSFDANVTTEQGSRLADGDLTAAPNPLQPLDMPEGTSVLIRGQALEGSAFEANYKAFTVGSTHTELSGTGFGVTREAGTVVQVYSGPVETVENSVFLGIGRQGVAAIGIGSDYSSETREMQTARIDLGTAEGQAAYQQFMSNGQVPGWSPPGVLQSGTTSIYNGESASFVGLQLGGLSIGGASDSQFTATETRWQDGTSQLQNTYTSPGGVTTDVQAAIGPDGKPIDAQTQWTVVRADLDPTLVSYLNASYNLDEVNKDFDGAQHVQMTFTSDELMELRDRARESVAAGYGNGDAGKEKLANLDSGVETPWWSATNERLAVAKTPGEVFAIMGDDFHGGTVIEGLLALSFESERSTTGTLQIRDAG